MFRVQIHHNRELILLKEKKGQSTMEDPRSLREDLMAVSRTLVSLPVLTSSLNGYVYGEGRGYNGDDGVSLYTSIST